MTNLKNKKKLLITVAAFSAIAATLPFVAKPNIFDRVNADEEVLKDTVLVFDGSNRPSELDPVNLYDKTHKFSDYVTLKYTQAKLNNNQKGYHCRLGNGGTIEKVEESLDLHYITITFGGSDSSGQPMLRLFKNKADTDYDEIEVVSGARYPVFGYNFFRIVNTVGSTNLNLKIEYGCREASDAELLNFEAKVKDNIAFLKNGRMPTNNDFEIHATYLVNGEEETYVCDAPDATLTIDENIVTEGGNIDFSWRGKSYTLNLPVSSLYEMTDISTKYECEDATLTNCTGLTQLAKFADPMNPVAGTEYTSVGKVCDYEKMHAAVYLDYTNELQPSGKEGTLGGLVHNFDTSSTSTATMKFTINSPTEKYVVLKARGASNDADRTKYKSNTLNVLSIAQISLNGEKMNNLLDPSAVFHGFTSSSADPNNRTGKIDSLDISGRFIYIEWDIATVGVMKLNAGENNIEFKATNSNKSGQWDYIELVDLEPAE